MLIWFPPIVIGPWVIPAQLDKAVGSAVGETVAVGAGVLVGLSVGSGVRLGVAVPSSTR